MILSFVVALLAVLGVRGEWDRPTNLPCSSDPRVQFSKDAAMLLMIGNEDAENCEFMGDKLLTDSYANFPMCMYQNVLMNVSSVNGSATLLPGSYPLPPLHDKFINSSSVQGYAAAQDTTATELFEDLVVLVTTLFKNDPYTNSSADFTEPAIILFVGMYFKLLSPLNPPFNATPPFNETTMYRTPKSTYAEVTKPLTGKFDVSKYPGSYYYLPVHHHFMWTALCGFDDFAYKYQNTTAKNQTSLRPLEVLSYSDWGDIGIPEDNCCVNVNGSVNDYGDEYKTALKVTTGKCANVVEKDLIASLVSKYNSSRKFTDRSFTECYDACHDASRGGMAPSVEPPGNCEYFFFGESIPKYIESSTLCIMYTTNPLQTNGIATNRTVGRLTALTGCELDTTVQGSIWVISDPYWPITGSPSSSPTLSPSSSPTLSPSSPTSPTNFPTSAPTKTSPTNFPTSAPTKAPTSTGLIVGIVSVLLFVLALLGTYCSPVSDTSGNTNVVSQWGSGIPSLSAVAKRS